MDAPNWILPNHASDDKSMIDDNDTYKDENYQITVPSILKNGNYVSDDKDSDDDALQKSPIQMDLEVYNAVPYKNEVNKKTRYETTINPKVLRQWRIWRHLLILKL